MDRRGSSSQFHFNDSDENIFREDEEQMLSFVIDAALKGTDIASSYPDFYQRMLATPRLHQAFLDALALLGGDDEEVMENLPQAPNRDLSFLKADSIPAPIVEHSTLESWKATWQLFQWQLSELFKPTPLVYRSSHLNLEDTSVILFRSQFEVEDTQFDAYLEAVCPVEEPDYLHLHLFTASSSKKHLPKLQAHLQWGTLQQTADINQHGHARFQPLLLTAVWDEATQTFLSNLQLILESEGKS